MPTFAGRSICFFAVLVFGVSGICAAQDSGVAASPFSTPTNADGGVSMNPTPGSDPSLIGSANSFHAGGALFNAGGGAFNPSSRAAQQVGVRDTLSKTNSFASGAQAKALSEAASGWRGTSSSASSAGTAVAASSNTVTVKDIGVASQYSLSFPDSTKGSAQINPPFNMTMSGVGLTPTVGGEFKDLSQAQFLNPQLHGGARSATKRSSEQDLYRKLEKLRSTSKSRDNGYKKSRNPFAPPPSPFAKEQNDLKGNSMSDSLKF